MRSKIELGSGTAVPAECCTASAASNTLICDFCSEVQIRWRYPASNSVDVASSGPTGVFASESIGDWAACEECHGLIEAGDHEALINRSVQKFVEIYGFLPPGLAEDIRRIHTQFFAHRCGLATEVVQMIQTER